MEFQPRKSLFVDSQIQGVLLRRFCLIWFGYHLALWHFMFMVWFFQQPPGGSFFGAYRQFTVAEPMLLIVAVAVFPPVLWGWLVLSHRIVGPLVQLRNRLRDMTEGKPAKRLELRPGDLMAELQTAFDNYVAYLEARDSHNETQNNGGADDDAARLLSDADELTTLTSDISTPETQHVVG